MHTLVFILLSVITTHKSQTFRTQCAVEVNAPAEMSDKVINQLVYDFQYDFEHLFEWAFRGLGKQNDDDRDALLLESRSITYEPEQEYGKMVLDVIVPGFITLPSIIVEGTIRDERGTSDIDTTIQANGLLMDSIRTWSRHMYIYANRTKNIFERAYGNLYVIPINERKSIYFMDINFRFEWFLRLFVTKRIYRNTIQWRVQQYMNNLKEAAEHPDCLTHSEPLQQPEI